MSDALDRIAPEAGPKGEALYRHEYVIELLHILHTIVLRLTYLLNSAEGPDDMPVRSSSGLCD